jgi:hypothetical protein
MATPAYVATECRHDPSLHLSPCLVMLIADDPLDLRGTSPRLSVPISNPLSCLSQTT